MRAILLLCLMLSSVPALAGFAEIKLPDMNASGADYDTAEHKSALVLDFYFNSCPACNENAPIVDSVAEEFHSAQVQFVGIGVDCDDGEYSSWIGKYAPIFPVLKACRTQTPRAMGVSAYPTVVILDCARNEIYRHVGVWSSAVKAEISDLLTEQIFRTCD